MVMYEADADQFTHDHLRMLLAVTPKIGLAVQNALKFQETEQRLNTDPVTGLPNSQQFLSLLDTEVARARRMKQSLSVIFLDTDGARDAYRERPRRVLSGHAWRTSGHAGPEDSTAQQDHWTQRGGRPK